MTRTVKRVFFGKWVVWSEYRRKGRFFDSKEEAERYANETGGIPEYIGEVFPT